MPTPNTAELVAIYQYIKAHPEEWDQGVYAKRTACGTAYCIAGHAAVRAGWKPLWPRREGNATANCLDGPRDDDGWLPLFDDVARDILGLTAGQASNLFDAGNGIDDIRDLIFEITGMDPESAESVSA